MSATTVTIASIACLAGVGVGAERPATAAPMKHLYVNAATGEVIATDAGPRGDDPFPVWELGPGPCPDSNGSLIVADDPDDPDRFGLIHLDWGDVEPGTTIALAQLPVYSEYPDADADGDGFADGVPGFGVRLAFFSGENGVAGGGSPVELGAVTLTDLPGNTSPGSGIQGYLLTIDLAGVGSPQGVPLGSTDVDNDGLADFGYSVEYLHPPTDDQPPRKTYLEVAAPAGQAVPDGQGGWTIIPDPAPNAQGTTDAIDVYRRDAFGDPEYVETIGGRFSCDPQDPGSYAQIAITLLGEAQSGCPADLFPPGGDGVLNFFDLSAYLGLFNAQDPAADFFPVAGDGLFNFFDIAEYLSQFQQGCP
jgi:hypothetical protein